jgi:peroxiredoxin
MKQRFTRTAGIALATVAVLGLGFGAVRATAGPEHNHGHAEKGPHAEGPAEAGQLAPDFTLTDLEGKEHNLHTYLAAGNVVVLEWFNPDCPFVQKHHQKTKNMAETRASFEGKKVVWLAINSGAEGKQGGGHKRNAAAVEEFKVPYPLLLDESGEVGKMYGAKTTPHMYVISAEGVLEFKGPIDDMPDVATIGKTNYVLETVNQLLAGKKVEPKDLKSYGCSVKYAS